MWSNALARWLVTDFVCDRAWRQQIDAGQQTYGTVALRKARGARIGALGRIPIDLMGNAVFAKLEAAVVLADGLAFSTSAAGAVAK
jgi:hypothetical protein